MCRRGFVRPMSNAGAGPNHAGGRHGAVDQAQGRRARDAAFQQRDDAASPHDGMQWRRRLAQREVKTKRDEQHRPSRKRGTCCSPAHGRLARSTTKVERRDHFAYRAVTVSRQATEPHGYPAANGQAR